MHIKCLLTIFASLVYTHLSFSIPKSNKNIASSQSVLDANGDLLLKWTVDYTLRRIKFELVISEKAPLSNWIALGFSDYGELDNADACLLWTGYNGIEHFEDVSTDNYGKVTVDDRQHCDAFVLDADARSIAFERAFDTCDDDDYIIEDGTTHVIWARGADTLYSAKGLCLPCTGPADHGFIRVRLLTPPPPPEPRARQLQITNDNLKVPASETTYWCKVQKLPEYITRTIHHVVQFESVVTPGNEGLVHHMEVFHCDVDAHADVPLYEGSCFAKDRPEITKSCSKVKAAWAMGALPFTYPLEAGLPLGGPNSNKYIMLEVHYNNPQAKKDWVDSSGIMIHVTASLRRYDAAIMELGLEYTDKMVIPGGQLAFPLTGHCIPQCTGVGLPPNGITVFGSQLHTHLTGVAVWTRHFRNGVELPALNRDRHYSQHFQEIRILHRHVKVLPGDYLRTTCMYNTKHKTNATIGGHAITDEMCVNYMHYYPASQLEVCKSSVSTEALYNYFEFEKRFDNMSVEMELTSRANFLSIAPWTPLRAQALNTLYTETPISMQCNKSDGNRFQGDWENMQIPKIRVFLPKQRRNCPRIYNINK